MLTQPLLDWEIKIFWEIFLSPNLIKAVLTLQVAASSKDRDFKHIPIVTGAVKNLFGCIAAKKIFNSPCNLEYV